MTSSLALKLQKFNQLQYTKLIEGKKIADFKPGDTIDVEFKQQGLTRPTIFTGICISKKSKGHVSSFTVIKMSDNVQIVKTFMLCSPALLSVSIKKHALKHRRAKLYYLVRKSDKV